MRALCLPPHARIGTTRAHPCVGMPPSVPFTLGVLDLPIVYLRGCMGGNAPRGAREGLGMPIAPMGMPPAGMPPQAPLPQPRVRTVRVRHARPRSTLSPCASHSLSCRFGRRFEATRTHPIGGAPIAGGPPIPPIPPPIAPPIPPIGAPPIGAPPIGVIGGNPPMGAPPIPIGAIGAIGAAPPIPP